MSEVKMKWSKLKLNRCPKCSARLSTVKQGRHIVCSKDACDFRITEQRMGEIIANKNEQDLKDTGEPAIYEGPKDEFGDNDDEDFYD